MSKKNNHTFVICAYKESPYLEECILSLKHQTVSSDICISTSTPCAYIDRIAGKYDIPVLQSDGSGIGGDWNSALRKAGTQYVTIAHQDDVYAQEYTEKVLEQFEKNPDGIIAFSDYHELYDGKVIPDNKNLAIKKLMLLPLRGSGKSRFLKRLVLAFGNPICCPAVAYNKNKLGDFQFEETMRSNLDWAAWETLSRQPGKFCYIPKALMMHRIHDGSETSLIIGDDSRSQEDLNILRLFWAEPVAAMIGRLYKNSEKGNRK